MKVTLHRQFRRDFKELGKKYPSLVSDVAKLVESLEVDPTQGESLGKNRYKIRLKITSKGKGKSGGGRVITCVEIQEDEVCLLTMYDKSEIENVNDDFLDELAKTMHDKK
jgi:mRNA-degrading endonuclease RelE of RelBE toxin-antitoxin system